MTFTVFEKTNGWFVKGWDELGPFLSRERAVNLAEGMVAAIRGIGEDAEVVMKIDGAAAPKRWVRAGSVERPFSRAV
jgi:hypothetical protein